MGGGEAVVEGKRERNGREEEGSEGRRDVCWCRRKQGGEKHEGRDEGWVGEEEGMGEVGEVER